MIFPSKIYKYGAHSALEVEVVVAVVQTDAFAQGLVDLFTPPDRGNLLHVPACKEVSSDHAEVGAVCTSQKGQHEDGNQQRRPLTHLQSADVTRGRTWETMSHLRLQRSVQQNIENPFWNVVTKRDTGLETIMHSNLMKAQGGPQGGDFALVKHEWFITHALEVVT